MQNESNRYFTITQNGKEVKYEILFTFDADETKKSYIVFTDHSKDSSGSIVTYAATYDKNGDNLELKDIETEKEWNLIENILSQIEDKIGE